MQMNIVNGSVEYDGEPILNEINFSAFQGDRIAIVGRNGCGKTTLLKAISKQIDMVKGTGEAPFSYSVSGNVEMGFLNQTFSDNDETTLEEQLLKSYSKIIELENKIKLCLEKMQLVSDEETVNIYSKLNDEYVRLNGYTYKKEYKTALKKFGFSINDLSKPLKEFSGGQRTKISLLTLLLSRPDVLLLDEPTNHLDLDAIIWLEDFLSSYKNCFIVVSHDRMFLDKIVNIVYEIEYGEIKKYKGNYSDFLKQKRINYDRELKDSLYKQKEVERLTKLVERFRYKASKAKMAQAKLKQIERIGDTSSPLKFDESVFRACFTPNKESVEKTLVLENLEFGYENNVLGKINTIIKRGDKIGIIGNNGCGKSTLLKTIMNIIPKISGRSYFGLHSEVGYFDQTKTQNYSSLSVIDYFHNDFPFLTDEEIRKSLGSFLFTKEDVFKTVGDLSGGEKVRLALCKIFKTKPNVLVLDEPTNHMDIIGKDALENMLSTYNGTVITVSHDRYFIEKVCNRLAVFENGKLNLYDCKYSEYEQNKKEKEKFVEEKDVEHAEKKQKPVSKEKEKTKILHRISVLDEKIEALEIKKKEIEKQIESDSSIYSDYKKYQEFENIIKCIDEELKPFLDEWSDLMEKID